MNLSDLSNKTSEEIKQLALKALEKHKNLVLKTLFTEQFVLDEKLRDGTLVLFVLVLDNVSSAVRPLIEALLMIGLADVIKTAEAKVEELKRKETQI